MNHADADRKNEEAILERYRKVAREFLEGEEEEALFHASELARDCLRNDVGPQRVTAIHLHVVQELESTASAVIIGNLGSRLGRVLLEVMVVYGEAQREVEQVLSTLRASQDELRRRTNELVQAEKLAALGELSASVVHEINQPLNAVMLICKDVSRDYERERLDLDTLSESLDSIVTEIRRVSQIVDQLRMFSRNTAGTRRERIEARSVVSKALRLLVQQLTVAGIEIVRDGFPDEADSADGLFVYGDGTQLQQVIINLTTNARDALQLNPGGRKRRITLEGRKEVRGSPPSSWVILTVSDTGPGIPDEHRDRIFEPFYTSKGPTKGTGLGLSVTRRIVEEHGGHIEVESELEKGTTFRVALPYCDEGPMYDCPS